MPVKCILNPSFLTPPIHPHLNHHHLSCGLLGWLPMSSPCITIVTFQFNLYKATRKLFEENRSDRFILLLQILQQCPMNLREIIKLFIMDYMFLHNLALAHSPIPFSPYSLLTLGSMIFLVCQILLISLPLPFLFSLSGILFPKIFTRLAALNNPRFLSNTASQRNQVCPLNLN